jgi:hypothetical protein
MKFIRIRFLGGREVAARFVKVRAD